VILTSSGGRATPLTIFLQGTLRLPAALHFGDGLRCAGGALKRIGSKIASGGVASYPQRGDPSISARSAALGDPLSPGDTRTYQAYYRDPTATFCPNPPGNTWNISNARSVTWIP
jgi:hypothetical protein